MEKFAQENSAPYSAEEISLKLHIPIAIIQTIINELLECQLISKINDEEQQESAYQPARDLRLLTDDIMIDTLKNNGESYTITLDNEAG